MYVDVFFFFHRNFTTIGMSSWQTSHTGDVNVWIGTIHIDLSNALIMIACEYALFYMRSLPSYNTDFHTVLSGSYRTWPADPHTHTMCVLSRHSYCKLSTHPCNTESAPGPCIYNSKKYIALMLLRRFDFYALDLG